MKKQRNKGTIRSRIKRGDEVVFITGREYNRYDSDGNRSPKTGRVIEIDRRNGKVKVEGAMIVKKHQKANPQMNIEGGIIQMEAWVNISNVAIVDPKSGKPSRIGYEIRDGKKVRIAKASGSVIPEPGVFKSRETAPAPATEDDSVEAKDSEKKAKAKPEEKKSAKPKAEDKETKDANEKAPAKKKTKKKDD